MYNDSIDIKNIIDDNISIKENIKYYYFLLRIEEDKDKKNIILEKINHLLEIESEQRWIKLLNI